MSGSAPIVLPVFAFYFLVSYFEQFSRHFLFLSSKVTIMSSSSSMCRRRRAITGKDAYYGTQLYYVTAPGDRLHCTIVQHNVVLLQFLRHSSGKRSINWRKVHKASKK